MDAVGKIYTGPGDLVSVQLAKPARAQTLRARKDPLQARGLYAVDAVGPPGGQQRGQKRGAMAAVQGADELAVVLEPALHSFAGLAVFACEALLVQRLKEEADERDLERPLVWMSDERRSARDRNARGETRC